jgi:hypothetical protein
VLLDHEFARLEPVCRAAGPGTRSTEAWTALVRIADAWSEYVNASALLYRTIRDAGLPMPMQTQVAQRLPGGS